MAGNRRDDGVQSLMEAATAWLPTSDPAVAARIIAILQQVATNGGDPIAELREGIARWFGPRIELAMPVQGSHSPVAPGSRLVFETLATH